MHTNHCTHTDWWVSAHTQNTVCTRHFLRSMQVWLPPPHHGGSNPYKVLQDPNGVQVRQPKESRAKKNYAIRSHELAAMTHKYTGHSFSSFF